MIFTVEEKRFVAGLNWSISIQDTSPKKAIRKQKKGNWCWYSDSSMAYGVLNEEDQKAKKKGVIYSFAVTVQLASKGVDSLGIFHLPDSDKVVVAGVIQNRPQSEFDFVCEYDAPLLSETIDRFLNICDKSTFSIVGDVDLHHVDQYSLEHLCEQASKYAEIKHLSAGLVNPVTIATALVAFGVMANFGYKKYQEYKVREAARIMAENQKTSQQLYDEALMTKREEPILPATQALKMYSEIRALPFSIAGWTLDSGKCNATGAQDVACRIRFSLDMKSKSNFDKFAAASQQFRLQNIVYKPDLKNIEASIVFKGFSPKKIGELIDRSKSVDFELQNFGSTLQKFLALGNPLFGEYQVFNVPLGVDTAKLSPNVPKQAKFRFTGPLRTLELLESFPDYASIDEVSFVVGKSPQYTLAQSLVTVEVGGSVFSQEAQIVQSQGVEQK